MSLAEITLDHLSGKIRFSPIRCAEFVEACKVCLEERKHSSGVMLSVKGIAETNFVLRWNGPLSQGIFDSWADTEEATEHGACAIAFLIVLEITQLEVIRRSRKKTGFDYWLTHKDDVIIRDAARLEISGIREGIFSTITGRVAKKLKQTKQSDKTHGTLPAYVVVVEFSGPVSHVEVRNVRP